MRTALHFAINLALVPTAALAFGISANTHDAPLGDYQPMAPGIAWDAFLQSRAHHPDNVPDWTRATARAYPGCEAVQDGVLYDTVVVVKSDASTVRMPFDKAWALGHDDERANDVWVIGGCAR